MSLYGFETLPPAIAGQLEKFTAKVADVLGGNLVGIYLHGSLAMGCFNPTRSDLDLLLVVDRGLTGEEKRQTASLMLQMSGHPSPLEVSILTRGALKRWTFPTPFDFHYSELWREKIENEVRAQEWTLWSGSPTDPDLATHITILHQRGIVLRGAPIAETFPPVPADDYLTAIWEADGKEAAAAIDRKPVYGVLNLCRVLAYLTDGLVLSKEEGGRWGLSHLPSHCVPAVRRALGLYVGRSVEQGFSPNTLSSFASHVVGSIEKQIASRGEYA